MGRLELRIKNPEAQVVDAGMPHRKASNEYPPSVVTSGDTAIFSLAQLCLMHMKFQLTHIFSNGRSVTWNQRRYSLLADLTT
jgi:hypothetical protein